MRTRWMNLYAIVFVIFPLFLLVLKLTACEVEPLRPVASRTVRDDPVVTGFRTPPPVASDTLPNRPDASVDVEEPPEVSVEEPADVPVEEPAEDPVEEQPEVPVEEPAEIPVEEQPEVPVEIPPEEILPENEEETVEEEVVEEPFDDEFVEDPSSASDESDPEENIPMPVPILTVRWQTPFLLDARRITLSGEYTFADGAYGFTWRELATEENASEVVYMVPFVGPADRFRFSVEYVDMLGITSWSCIGPYPPGATQGRASANVDGLPITIETIGDPTGETTGCGLVLQIP